MAVAESTTIKPVETKTVNSAAASEVTTTNGTSPVKNVDGAVHKEAMNHFIAGKRHLLVKDLHAAVDSLTKACELMAEEFGEAAYECADAYYYYGKALLELARAEAGVFGNALDGVPDGEDSDNSQVEDPEKMTEEERDDVEKKVGEALDENYSAMEEKRKKKADDETEEDETEGEDGDEEKETDGEKTDGDVEMEDKEKADEPEKEKTEEAEKEKTEETKDTESVGGADADEKEGEDQKEQEAEDEEDPSNLQLAWEMLELAKVAYEKHLKTLEEPEAKKGVEAKLCETLLTLGEVSLESENYKQAVADITDCLTKRKASLPVDSRRIAETLYQLGVALGLDNQFDEAVTIFEESIQVLQKRVTNLKSKTESVDDSKANDTFYTREGEIIEIESLIPEIRDKIADTKDSKDQTESNQKEEEGFSKGGDAKVAKPISSIPIKRKAEGDAVSPQKKQHIENGDSAKANGDCAKVNGDAATSEEVPAAK